MFLLSVATWWMKLGVIMVVLIRLRDFLDFCLRKEEGRFDGMIDVELGCIYM